MDLVASLLFSRNLMLKVSVLGVLCYHWLGRVATEPGSIGLKVTSMMKHCFQFPTSGLLFCQRRPLLIAEIFSNLYNLSLFVWCLF